VTFPHDAVKSPASSLRDRGRISDTCPTCKERSIMKRSRRVVLTLMGSGAVTAVSASLAVARPVTCGPGYEAVSGPHGFPTCLPRRTGGFGGSFQHFHGHGHGHGHAGG
jgi:hypothetical protein